MTRPPLLPEPLAERFVPVEGRVDRRQLGALLRLQLVQTLRRGTDASSGMSGHPLRQILFSMTFLGLLSTGGAFRDVPLDLFLARVFGSALVIVALMVTAESDDARIRRMEILLPKPVAGATHVASVATQLLLMSTLVVVPYALPSLAAASWWLGLSPALVPLLLATLVAGAFTLVLVWVLVVRAGVQRLGADRIRMATQAAVVGVMILFGLVGPVGRFRRRRLRSAGAARAGPARAPVDLARDVLDRRMARCGQPAAGGRRGPHGLRGRGVPALRAAGVRGRAVRDDLARAPYARAARRPAARRDGPGARPPAVAAAARGRARRRASSTLGRAGGGVAPAGVRATLLAVGHGGLGPLCRRPADADRGARVVHGLDRARGPLGGAAERGRSCRLGGGAGAAAARHVVRAVQWAVLGRFVLLPQALFGVLAFRQHPWYLAVLLVAGSFAAARLVVASALAIRPSIPLGEPPVVAGFVAQVTGWALGIAGAVAYVMAATLASLLGVIGLALVAMGVLAAFAASVAVQMVAAHRVGRLELAA